MNAAGFAVQSAGLAVEPGAIEQETKPAVSYSCGNMRDYRVALILLLPA